MLLPIRDLPAGERPVADFDVLAQRLPQGVLHLEDGILTADGTTLVAEQLDKSLLKAKRMINLDGDEEGATFVACSCSDRVLLDRSYEG